jgi:hypothetical protein
MRSIVPQAIAPDNEETYRRTVVAARVALREAVACPYTKAHSSPPAALANLKLS